LIEYESPAHSGRDVPNPLVMTGKLDDFHLADVLQVVGLSPQLTAVELRRRDGNLHGTIYVKAGRVLAAERGDVRGRAAFYELFGAAAATFVVSRRPEPAPAPAPLGSLMALLMETPAAIAKGSQVAPLPVAAPAPSRCIAIASPKGGVGKTTIACHVAVAFAQRGRSTIVIDADVNGDLTAMLAQGEVRRGAYDMLEEPAALDEVLRETSVPGLRLVPACGAGLPATALERRSRAAGWRALIARARERADLVLVDCPAGMFDTTGDVLPACTHVIGVLPSDMIGVRSSQLLDRGLAAITAEQRPQLAGVVVNLFQGRSIASIEAFQRIAAAPPGRLLFETTIPRCDAFAAPRLAAEHPIAWLFDALAAEIGSRAGLPPSVG